MEPVVHGRPGDDTVDPRFPSGRTQRPVATQRDTDQAGRFNTEMVQHRAHRLLPVVVEGQPSQSPGPSLSGAVECDHVEPRLGDTLPDGVELLDQ